MLRRTKNCGITSGDVRKVQCFFAHGTSNSRGTLIAFREGLNYKVLSSHLNDNGRYVILKVEIELTIHFDKLLCTKRRETAGFNTD